MSDDVRSPSEAVKRPCFWFVCCVCTKKWRWSLRSSLICALWEAIPQSGGQEKSLIELLEMSFDLLSIKLNCQQIRGQARTRTWPGRRN